MEMGAPAIRGLELYSRDNSEEKSPFTALDFRARSVKRKGMYNSMIFNVSYRAITLLT